MVSTLTEQSPEVRTERLAVAHDQATGMQAVIAIDDTTRGPGLGGVRWMPYPTSTPQWPRPVGWPGG